MKWKAEIERIWPQLTVEEPIGRGTFGEVYRVSRRGFGRSYYSAVKVIPIPGDETDVQEMRHDGMDEQSIQSYLEGMAEQLADEIDLMESLKAAPNIVTIEDFSIQERENRRGFLVLIRMELLENLNDYRERKGLSRPEVVKLGLDLCSALEYCEQRNIIHRDIKPANIFVTDFGDFKLGDFGVSRQVWLSSVRSRKGTSAYMAPEVVRGEAYDRTVDLYSLGIVLYRLLNDNRLPFLPPAPEPVRFEDHQNAVLRRMTGEAFPPPVHGDPALSAIVRRACAFRREERYASASELKAALRGWLDRAGEDGEKLREPEASEGKTPERRVKAEARAVQDPKTQDMYATNYSHPDILRAWGEEPREKEPPREPGTLDLFATDFHARQARRPEKEKAAPSPAVPEQREQQPTNSAAPAPAEKGGTTRLISRVTWGLALAAVIVAAFLFLNSGRSKGPVQVTQSGEAVEQPAVSEDEGGSDAAPSGAGTYTNETEGWALRVPNFPSCVTASFSDTGADFLGVRVSAFGSNAPLLFVEVQEDECSDSPVYFDGQRFYALNLNYDIEAFDPDLQTAFGGRAEEAWKSDWNAVYQFLSETEFVCLSDGQSVRVAQALEDQLGGTHYKSLLHDFEVTLPEELRGAVHTHGSCQKDDQGRWLEEVTISLTLSGEGRNYFGELFTLYRAEDKASVPRASLHPLSEHLFLYANADPTQQNLKEALHYCPEEVPDEVQQKWEQIRGLVDRFVVVEQGTEFSIGQALGGSVVQGDGYTVSLPLSIRGVLTWKNESENRVDFYVSDREKPVFSIQTGKKEKNALPLSEGVWLIPHYKSFNSADYVAFGEQQPEEPHDDDWGEVYSGLKDVIYTADDGTEVSLFRVMDAAETKTSSYEENPLVYHNDVYNFTVTFPEEARTLFSNDKLGWSADRTAEEDGYMSFALMGDAFAAEGGWYSLVNISSGKAGAQKGDHWTPEPVYLDKKCYIKVMIDEQEQVQQYHEFLEGTIITTPDGKEHRLSEYHSSRK